MNLRRKLRELIDRPGLTLMPGVYEETWGKAATEAHELELRQQCAAGLNFGYFYADSPIIAYDGEEHPVYSVHEFISSTVPGCRAPHVWLTGHTSLYDVLGAGYTLIRTDKMANADGLIDAAKQRGVPLKLLDIDEPDAKAAYKCKLTLVRPDQHVAWRGDQEPDEPLNVMDLVRGAIAN